MNFKTLHLFTLFYGIFHFHFFHTIPSYSTENLFETVDSDWGDFHDWKWEQAAIGFLLTFLKIKLFSFVLIYFTSEFSIYNLFETPLRIRATASDATRHHTKRMTMKCWCNLRVLIAIWNVYLSLDEMKFESFIDDIILFCFCFHLLHFSLGRSEWIRIWFWVNLRINLILFYECSWLLSSWNFLCSIGLRKFDLQLDT